MGRELEHGNLVLHAKSRNSIGKAPRIQIRYLVERAAVRLRALRLPLLGEVLRPRPRLDSGRRLLHLQVWQASPVRRFRNELHCLVGRQRRRTESPQKGERLLFFAGPYAEINGVAHRSVERRVHFNEV
jgi:hypothetical protein